MCEVEDSPESVLRACRDRIERLAPANERENLLAVTQVLAALRYNEADLLNILGGRKAMIESPVLVEIVSEAQHKMLLAVLEKRFGQVPQGLADAVRGITDWDTLLELAGVAGTCPDLESFEQRLRA